MRPQHDLFGASAFPAGFDYRADLVTSGEAAALIEAIALLALGEAKYRGFVAKRRTASFGYGYDFTTNRLEPAARMPAFLAPLRDQVAAWTGVASDAFIQALVTEYRPGTPIGWHRDVPQFGVVVGISLGSACRMRFRPYPPTRETMRHGFTLHLDPRSAYVLRDDIRWGWQHSIPPVRSLRWSITFRTLKDEQSAHGTGVASS